MHIFYHFLCILTIHLCIFFHHLYAYTGEKYVYRNNSTPIVFIGLDDLTKGNPDYKNAFSYLNETEEELYIEEEI